MAKSIDDGKMKSARIFAFVGVADDLQEEQISSRREFSANAFPLCTFFFEKKVRKKAIQEAHPPERPPEKVQGGVSLLLRLYPKQRRECSSNLKVFLIVRGFCVCGNGENQKGAENRPFFMRI